MESKSCILRVSKPNTSNYFDATKINSVQCLSRSMPCATLFLIIHLFIYQAVPPIEPYVYVLPGFTPPKLSPFGSVLSTAVIAPLKHFIRG